MSTENYMTPQTEERSRLLKGFPPASYEEWREAAMALLKGAPFEKKLLTKTYEGITLQPIYMAEETKERNVYGSFPGFAPYLRGISTSGYKICAWNVAQEYRCALPEQMNAAIREDLGQGQDVLAFQLDLAGRRGQDPDAAPIGDVGCAGVSLATCDDVQTAFDGLDLESFPLLAYTGAATIPFAALLAAYCRQHGIVCENLRGSVGFDPLGRLASEGKLPFALATAYTVLTSFTRWAQQQAPHLKTILIDGSPYHESGGNAVQELACVLATGVEYLRELQTRELSIDDVAGHMQFTLTVGSEYFLEIAKVRAARVVWAHVVKACGGNADAQKMSIHIRTSRRGKTLHDPYVNLLRASVEAFAGVVGGCESLHVGRFDDVAQEAAQEAEPCVFANRIARNVQSILKEESHLNEVLDPIGGSWYVERLTDEIARKAWELFQEIERRGGMAKALESRDIQDQLAATAAQRRANLATRKDVLVGTNLYANIDEQPLRPNASNTDDVYRARLETLQAFKATRIFQELTPNSAALIPGMETLIAAAEQGATLGELMRMCCPAEDSPASITPVTIQRSAEMFEHLRAASERYKDANGHRPRVFMANMGPLKQHKARADFSQAFFEVAGFEMLSNYGFHSVDEAAEAAIHSRAPMVVICSTDDTYPDIVPPFTEKIKSANPETIVILAGYPQDDIETFKQSGVNEFIHMRANVYDTLARIMQTLGTGVRFKI